MKRLIYSATGHEATYSGKAYETYKKVTNGITSYKPNEFYVNEKTGHIFYINNAGYLHILLKENGCIEDYMLTKKDMLKPVSTYCRIKYDKETWEQFKEMIKNAERV